MKYHSALHRRRILQTEQLESRLLLTYNLTGALEPSSGGGIQSYAAFGDAIATSDNYTIVGSPYAGVGSNGSAGKVGVYDPAGQLVTTLSAPESFRTREFGASVAIDGDTIVVGQPSSRESSTETYFGVVFVFDAASPDSPSYIFQNPNPDVDDEFGSAVAIDGNRIVVGAKGDDAGDLDAGIAYVYDLGHSSPTTPRYTLNNPFPDVGCGFFDCIFEKFGASVAIAGDQVFVGAPGDYANGTEAGLVWEFDLGSVTPTAYEDFIVPASPTYDGRFGSSLAFDGNKLIVGAENESGAGRVHIYDASSQLQASISNPQSNGDLFGRSVALDGDALAVGAVFNDSGATNNGSVYVYDLAAAQPSFQHAIHNPTPAIDQAFGSAVAVRGDQLFVGTPSHDGEVSNGGKVDVFDLAASNPASTVTSLEHISQAVWSEFGSSVAASSKYRVVGAPRSATNDASNVGRVEVFDQQGELLVVLPNPHPTDGDNFGASVAVDDDWVIVGSPNEDSAVSETTQGVAYAFDMTADDPTVPRYTLYYSPSVGATPVDFGSSVAIHNGQAIVGAPETSNLDGAAYIFDLNAPDPLSNVRVLEVDLAVRLGTAVAVHDEVAVVGAWGTAYVYDLTRTSNFPIAFLADTSSSFGQLVAVSESFVVVTGSSADVRTYSRSGSQIERLDRIGGNSSLTVQGDLVAVGSAGFRSHELANAGTVAVYDLSNANAKSPIATIQNPLLPERREFGTAVAFGLDENDDNVLLVGAKGDSTFGFRNGLVDTFRIGTSYQQLPVASRPDGSAAMNDWYGSAVAVNDRYMVIGAERADVGGAFDNGQLYVYDVMGPQPVFLGNIDSPSSSNNVNFGASVAISGSVVVVGASGEDLEDLSSPGSPDLINAGVAYLYDLEGSNWNQPVATIVSPRPQSSAQFGWDVAISGDTVVVGAYGFANRRGAVEVFDISSGTPIHAHSLNNPQASTDDRFGWQVDVNANEMVVVSAPNEDGAEFDSGVAYLFDLNGSSPRTPLGVVQHPMPAPGNNGFGYSLAIGDEQFAVGTPFHDGNGENSLGIVHVFDFDDLTGPAMTLNNPIVEDAWFGHDLAMEGTQLVVGASRAEFDDLYAAGAAYLYELDDGNEFADVILMNPDPHTGDIFGEAVAVGGGNIAVGSFRHEAVASDQGAAFLYRTPTNTAPQIAPQELVVNELQSEGVVAQVAASDVESAITYEIIGGTGQSRFAIDPATGELSVTGFINHEQIESFTLDVEVVDEWGVHRSAEVTVLIEDALMELNQTLTSGVDPSSQYGAAVDISTKYRVVGAPGSDVDAIMNAGSVFVYNRYDELIAQIDNPAPETGDSFGGAVAIDGEFVIVGASGDEFGASDAGSVYVFEILPDDTLALIATLQNPTPESGDLFGGAIAAEAGKILVGATGDNAGAMRAGSVYAFDLNSTDPTMAVATYSNPAPVDFDGFGDAIDLENGLAAIGVPFGDAGSSNAGLAYIYDLMAMSSTPLLALPNPAPGSSDTFGDAVAISNGIIAVGAPGNSASVTSDGGVYIFDVNSSAPTVPLLSIDNPTPNSFDLFGSSLSMSDDFLIAGAFNDDAAGDNSGAAFFYDLSSSTPEIPIPAFGEVGLVAGEFFGRSVAVSGNNTIVGSPNSDLARVFGNFQPRIEDQTLSVSEANDGERTFATIIASDIDSSLTYTITGGSGVGVFELDESLPGQIKSDGNLDFETRESYELEILIVDEHGETSEAIVTVEILNEFGEYRTMLPEQPPMSGDWRVNEQIKLTDDYLVVQETDAIGGARLAIYDTDYELITTIPDPDGWLQFSDIDVWEDTIVIGSPVSEIVYVYELSGGVATLTDTITDPNAGGFRFGVTVAFEDGVLAVATDTGRQVQVFDFSFSTNVPILTLFDPVDERDGFGLSMDLDGGKIAVGSRNDAAYVYDLNSSTPFLPTIISTPSASPTLEFGRRVGMSGDWLVVSDPTQSRNGSASGRFLGAVFAFDLSAPDPTVPTVAFIDPAPHTARHFGQELSISGTSVAVNTSNTMLLYDLNSDQPQEALWSFAGSRRAGVRGDQVAIVDPGKAVLIYQTDPTSLAFEDQSFIVAEDDDGLSAFGNVAAISPGTVAFAITGGNDAGDFQIDATTGALSSTGALDHDSSPAYDLEVTASNSLGQMATAMMHVDVVNVAPTLALSHESLSIFESGLAENGGQFSDPGGGVVTFSASVGDVIENSDGTWSWSLQTTSAADSQVVQVDATDAGGLVTSVTFDLEVNVTPPIAFVGTRSDGQIELFRSSGTSADTVLLKNVGGRQSSNPHELTVVGDSLFFAATGADGEVELFKTQSNGSTARVKDIAGPDQFRPA